MHLAFDATHLTELAEEAMALQTDGVAAALLDRAQVQELIQTPLGRDIVGGRFMPEEGVAHPIRFVQGLVQAAQRSGVRACVTTVRQLVPHRGRVVVHTMHGPLQAETIIVAVNAGTGVVAYR